MKDENEIVKVSKSYSLFTQSPHFDVNHIEILSNFVT